MLVDYQIRTSDFCVGNRDLLGFGVLTRFYFKREVIVGFYGWWILITRDYRRFNWLNKRRKKIELWSRRKDKLGKVEALGKGGETGSSIENKTRKIAHNLSCFFSYKLFEKHKLKSLLQKNLRIYRFMLMSRMWHTFHYLYEAVSRWEPKSELWYNYGFFPIHWWG